MFSLGAGKVSPNGRKVFTRPSIASAKRASLENQKRIATPDPKFFTPESIAARAKFLDSLAQYGNGLRRFGE